MPDRKAIYVNAQGDFTEVDPSADFTLAKGVSDGSKSISVARLDRLHWADLAASWTSTPTLTASITGGDVYTYTYGLTTYFRFVPNPYDPAADQFFSNFNGVTLSGLLATRGLLI